MACFGCLFRKNEKGKSTSGASKSNPGTSKSNLGTSKSNLGASKSKRGASQSNLRTSKNNLGTSKSNLSRSSKRLGPAFFSSEIILNLNIPLNLKWTLKNSLVQRYLYEFQVLIWRTPKQFDARAIFRVYVPKGIENNGVNVYLAKTSPPNVFEMYRMQFQKDFTTFLESRLKEIIDGGHMVLAFGGQSDIDPSCNGRSRLLNHF
nr:benzoate carboxyl methyltransferase-like [Tanacetum cinerariifolium]